MKKNLLILLLSLTAGAFAQNHPPVVSNLHFLQRDDGTYLVDIWYDLVDADNNVMQVSMQVSGDDGVTWNFSASPLNMTGDIGSWITGGTNKHIVWNFAADHPNQFVPHIKIKIIADDGVVNQGIPCPDVTSFTYGGQTYHAVLIGHQCWMKENLNIGTRVDINAQQDNGIIEKCCYQENPANCDVYGGLYSWSEATGYSTGPSICPAGWHLPDENEWFELLATLDPYNTSPYQGDYWGGNKLMEQGTAHWAAPNAGATNETGFTALGAGYIPYGYPFYYAGLTGYTYFWSSTAYFMSFPYGYGLGLDDVVQKAELGGYSASVRCVKNTYYP